MSKVGINKVGFFALLAFVGAILATTVQAASSSEKEILERIKPVGEVCLQGDTECAGAAGASAGSAGPRSGEDIYKASCGSCHGAAAAALGAPGLGNAADWAPRTAKGEDSLLSSAINGINAMPPKGTCMDCSDEELAAAIDYMVSNSQ